MNKEKILSIFALVMTIIGIFITYIGGFTYFQVAKTTTLVPIISLIIFAGYLIYSNRFNLLWISGVGIAVLRTISERNIIHDLTMSITVREMSKAYSSGGSSSDVNSVAISNLISEEGFSSYLFTIIGAILLIIIPLILNRQKIINVFKRILAPNYDG